MSDVLRVLFVEDSPTDAKLVLAELQRLGRSIESERVETAEAMRRALDERPWDLVISDWSMPHFSAALALAVLREKDLDLPFIIVSGTVGEDSAVEAMRAGARDYVLKDKLARLGPAVERELFEQETRKERRRAEAALRASEMRYRTLAGSGMVGITVAEGSGRIVEANDAFLATVGYSRDDLESGCLSWTALTPAEWVESSFAAIEQLRVHGVAHPWEKEYKRKDGSRVAVLVGVAALGAQNIAISIDLTERKLAEAARVRAEESLKQTEAQLRQSQKMEAIGRLAGGVAHDFNNVLSVILCYGEMLLADLKPGDAMQEEIAEIQRAGERAAALTRQLLMFSRQQVLAPRIIDLAEILSGMNKMLQRILGADVELVTLSPPSLGSVYADPSSLEQIVMNLVVNARDAMPTGGRLTIETKGAVLDDAYAKGHPGVTAGRYIMLTVSDTGTGMDEATLTRIFEPFFTTKGIGKGTGLGLSTVFGLAQQAGGSVSVHSELGKGTTFEVFLPSRDAAVQVPTTSVFPSSRRGSETILVVEDDDALRAVARGILRRGGYHVLEAHDASEAFLTSEEHSGKIHLLLTDVVMPRMSGPVLAKQLTSTRRDMKVLCMSGYTDDSVVRHGVLEGQVAYLQKPITPDALLAKVREVLDGVEQPTTSP